MGFRHEAGEIAQKKNIPVAKIPDPQNFNLDNEYAAKTLITMDITTTDIVTIIVFLKKVRKGVSVNKYI